MGQEAGRNLQDQTKAADVLKECWQSVIIAGRMDV
jgi:hypothetical protein